MNYALINTATGLVENTFVWDGGDDWAAPEGYEAIQSDEVSTGWSYADGVFTAPPPPPVTPPSPVEILAANTAMQSALQATASQAMTPLLLSLQLGDATTDETAQAKLWQTYSRELQAIDLTASSPGWPVVPA